MEFELSAHHQQFVERIRDFAQERIAPRAQRYDREYEAPLEDIQDLHREGLLLANLDKRFGGLGYGVDGEDPLAFILAIETLAAVNPSTAHCFQVHNHVVQMASLLGDEDQRRRWLTPTMERGALLAGVGSEPKGAPPTVARPVAGGYRVDGVKYYATNASLGEWATMTVRAGDAPGPPMRFMINHHAPGVTVDCSEWRPMGMKSCISPTVYLEDYFAPTEDVVAYSDDPRDRDWLGKFHVAFAANYVGTAAGIYEWMRGYVRERSTADPLRTLRVGELRCQLDAARLLLYRGAAHFKKDRREAMLMGCQAKWMAKHTLTEMLRTSAEVVGSSALFEKYPLEKLYRDGQLHMLHSRIDVVASTIGAAELGLEYDINQER
jgi:alkylation response protein AidB-like acyl-CoA dehydrogenase